MFLVKKLARCWGKVSKIFCGKRTRAEFKTPPNIFSRIFKNCANFSFRYCFLGCSAIALLFYRLLCLESPFQLALGICHNKAKLAKIVRNDILPPALIQMQTARVNCIVQNRLNIHFVEVSF